MTPWFTFDDRRFPLLVTVFHRQADDEDVEELLALSDRVLERGEPYAWLFEVRSPLMTTPRQRLRFTEWMRTNEWDVERLCRALAVAQPNFVSRIVSRSIFLMQPPLYPYAIVRTRRAAESWIVGRLRAQGLDIPRAAAAP